MILRTNSPMNSGSEIVPAWDAVEATQRVPAESFTMITQPEHAALAGDLAARFTPGPFPQPTTEIVHAIAWHDQGWAVFDYPFTALVPPRQRIGAKPRSFIAMNPPDFVVAWTRSIEDCERISPRAGAMVSEHFCRLARFRQRRVQDPPRDALRIEEFLDREAHRQESLLPRVRMTRDELGEFTDLLQFCDLLSLYLCCGTSQAAGFPQKFGGRTVQIRYQDGEYVMTPSPFHAPVDVGVNRWKFPGGGMPQQLAILLR